MKQHIVILFGDVTDKQYQPLGDAMREQQLEPRVVRVPSDMAASEFFVMRALDEFNTMNGSWGAPGYEQYVDKRAPEMQAAYLHDLMGDATLGDVKAIIYQVCPEYGTDKLWQWLTSELDGLDDSSIAVYDVQASDCDDSHWLSGDGFGEILELASR